MWAEYVTAQRAPDADPAKVQSKWLDDLQVFVAKHPKSSDAAEALLQLGMYQEFVGKNDEATKWYRQLISDFPNAKLRRQADSLERQRHSGR
jgi:TolA-binding protein